MAGQRLCRIHDRNIIHNMNKGRRKLRATRTPRVYSDPSDFQALESYADQYSAKHRTNSAALLIWFLSTVYRLDEVEAQDAVCDRQHDEGIDALVVNDSRREIVLFQSKRREKLPATLGDTDLKAFVGSLAHFRSKKSVAQLQKTTKNDELSRLLKTTEVADKIESGYGLRPIFVTNVAAGPDAKRYLSQAQAAGHEIELWDLSRLGPVLKQLSRDWFIEERARLKADSSRRFTVGPKRNPGLIYAALPANQLVTLPGIEDLRIFAQNVRLGLGNTRVNSEIVDSVINKKEHPNFIAFHNGLTIVAKELSVRGDTITIGGFSVCNGCQSLMSIWENRRKLTDKLELLVRIVRVGNDRRLPELIAYRTNNQNAISLRDLSSNDTAQVHLKNEFDGLFGDYSTYVIKRGEKGTSEELGNEYAGRLLLALYVGEPWSAHQKYRIFGDLENRIFNYDISASHIRLAQLIGKSAARALTNLPYERDAKYGLTEFILVYLIGQVIQASTDGQQLIKNPLPTLTTSRSLNPKESQLAKSLDEIAQYVTTELTYFIKGRGEEAYDYKNNFKLQSEVNTIRNEVLKALDKDVAIGRARKFTLPS
jgi:AIPR protein